MTLFRDTKTLLHDPDFRRMVRALCDLSMHERLDVTACLTADSPFSVTHHLGRKPAGVIQHIGDAAGKVYADDDDRAAWTQDALQLKCDTADWHGKIDIF